MSDNGKYESTIYFVLIMYIYRVTIPTTENGDVSTFVVQDGFVFDSGAGIKFEFSNICVVSFLLFAWSLFSLFACSVFHYLRGQFFTICVVTFSPFAWLEGEVVTWLEQWDDNGRPNACGVRSCLTKNG